MTKKQIITILAPYSWSAAIVPVTITALFFLYEGGSLKPDLFLGVLISAILGQSFTNIVNCYSDFTSGLDNPDTIIDPAGSVIVGEGVDPREVKLLMVWVFFISMLPVLYLTYVRGPYILILSLVGVLLGMVYSAGPHPISTTPIGEVYSGIIDGIFISMLSYYVFSGTFSYRVILIGLPAVFWVSTMTFTNSICDMEKDREYRTTLALFLGKNNSIIALKLFYLGIFLALVVNITLGLLPMSLLLTLLTVPVIIRRLSKITPENTNMENKFPIMGLSCGSGLIFFKTYTLIMIAHIVLRRFL